MRKGGLITDIRNLTLWCLLLTLLGLLVLSKVVKIKRNYTENWRIDAEQTRRLDRIERILKPEVE